MNMEIFFTYKTRDIPQMSRNIFITIVIGTLKLVQIISNIHRKIIYVDDKKTLPKKKIQTISHKQLTNLTTHTYSNETSLTNPLNKKLYFSVLELAANNMGC